MNKVTHVVVTVDTSKDHFGRDYCVLGGFILLALTFGVLLWHRYRKD